jgi:dTDP-4-dehydrorhamnose 3,5-epimerase
LWIPEGFAHGFQVTSDYAIFCYLCTQPYRADSDRALYYADDTLKIEWPDARGAQLSEKDKNAPRLEALTSELSLVCVQQTSQREVL